jgi:protein-S-isoprenylcysteine O-methyltransferase Ste14
MKDFTARGGWWVVVQGVLLGGVLLALLLVDGGFGVDGAPASVVIGAGVVILGAGIVMIVAGSSALGRNLTPYPAPLDDGEMVVHGAYRWVRHPVYGGVALCAVGAALVSANLAALAIGLVLFPFFYAKSGHEERHLTETYPGYAEYRLRVRKRLVPGVI